MWTGEFKATDQEDPASKLAEAFMSMLGFRMELGPENNYKMWLMGVPIHGTYSITGNNITLTSLGAGGMSWAEFEKTQQPDQAQGLEDAKRPLNGTISADRQSIEIESPDSETKGMIVFTREKPEADPIESTVSMEEAPLVGQWMGVLDLSKMEFESEGERSMAAAMAEQIDLNLRADNTFRMRMIMDFKGTWSVKNGELVLNSEDGGDPGVFVVRDGGATLQGKGAENEALTFKRK
jgi:hypothetical protein